MYNSGKLVIEGYARGIKKCALPVALVAKRAQKIKLKTDLTNAVRTITANKNGRALFVYGGKIIHYGKRQRRKALREYGYIVVNLLDYPRIK